MTEVAIPFMFSQRILESAVVGLREMMDTNFYLIS